MSEHHQFDKDLSEPLNPHGSSSSVTAKELSEWMVCTNCYPKEKVYTIAYKDLNHEEKQQRDKEIKAAKRMPSQAMLDLHSKYGGSEGLMRMLDTNMDSGISSSSAEKRREQYGNNAPLERKTKTICDMILENLGDYFMILLMIAAGVELVLGIWQEGWSTGWIDGASIFMAVAIITSVNVVNSYKTEKTFAKLMDAEDDVMVKVLRDGKVNEVHVNDIVVGDIMIVEKDKKIRADAIVITANDMKTNESDLTGEKDLMDKIPYHNKQENGRSVPEGKPFIFKGCITTDGDGKALITNVGTNTNEGQMQKQMDFEDNPTPLQRKLNTIVTWIGMIGIVSAALVFLALTLRLVFDIWAFGSRDLADERNLNDITQAFIVAVTVVVMAVPEGLPLAVTISLQFSIADLEKKHGALIRKPDATETMGGCNEICSDKTGTLTANKMTNMGFWVEEKFYDEYEKREKHGHDATCHGEVQRLGTIGIIADAVLISSSTSYVTSENKKGEQETKLKGNPTEIAMFNYLLACDQDMTNDHKDDLMKKAIFVTPFDSKKKYNTVAYRKADGGVRIVVKGAPDFLGSLCTRIERTSGNVEKFRSGECERILGQDVISKFAEKCYRTILVAYKDFSEQDWATFVDNNDVNSMEDVIKKAAREATENNLIMSCIFGIEDPLRNNIPETIRRLAKAGVRTRMCTGDNVETAKSICMKAGIIVDPKDETDPEIIKKMKDELFMENKRKYECMTGEEFRKQFGVKNEEKGTWQAAPKSFHWKTQIIQHLKCLARSSPTDKQILVEGIQKYSDPQAIVAVTGDGTNDCPALKMADVGFAMNTGSDAAKTESKVVLLDDDFNSTLICVKYGRNIYDAVQKFLQFQLTVNVVAIVVVLMGAVVLNEKVLTSVQILWVNMIMDTFAALALATEPALDSLLERAPTNREESIVSNVMARNILGWSIYQISVLCTLLFTGKSMFNLQYEDSTPFYWTEADSAMDGDLCTGVIDPTTGVCAIKGHATDKVVMYTMVFNLFVWLQVFNQFNARKIGNKEFNVFAGLTQNCWFVGISLITVVVQILAILFGGRPLRCTPLNMEQTLFTIGLGVGMIPWNLICGLVLQPEWFNWASACVPNKEATDEDEAESGVIAMSGRASVRAKLSMRDAMKKKLQAAVEDEQKKDGDKKYSLN